MSLLKRSSILSHQCFYLFEECVFPPNAAFITVVGADRLRELPCLSLCWGKKKLLYSHRFCRVIYLRFYRRVMEWYVRKIAKNRAGESLFFKSTVAIDTEWRIIHHFTSFCRWNLLERLKCKPNLKESIFLWTRNISSQFDGCYTKAATIIRVVNCFVYTSAHTTQITSLMYWLIETSRLHSSGNT